MPTNGDISIVSSKFDTLYTAVFIDVIDHDSILPMNMDAKGEIKSNTFINVGNEVELLYAGDKYDGELVIEKHEKL